MAAGGVADNLQARASAGDADAQIEIGLKFEREANTPMARAWFARAVKAQSTVAMRLLARSLFLRPPMVLDHAVPMMRAAAESGDAEAQHYCALFAAMDATVPDRWRVALDWSARAAAQGFPIARAEMKFFEGIENQMEALTQARPIRMVHQSPRIAIIENCASPRMCDWFIEHARPRLHAAVVYDTVSGAGRADPQRNNQTAEFDLSNADLVLLLLQARIAAIANAPRIEMETMSVLHYTPGQRFEPHFDFLDAAVPGYARDIAMRGQRVATFLLSLNDDYDGGETEFPQMDFRYKGKKGDALLFWNVDPAGRPDAKTLHAGLPTTRGEKWLLSQWLRRKD